MLKFEKYHGAGNDFIIFNGIDRYLPPYDELAKRTCDRHFGIGADGIMIVEASSIADIKMVFYNADGTRAPMCGNGIRCFSKYVYEHGLVKKQDFTVETLAGIMKPQVYIKNNKVSEVRVNLGKPIFNPDLIPALTDQKQFINEKLEINRETCDVSAVMMGTIHAVIFKNDLKGLDIERIGAAIENHKRFPKRTNVNFCKIQDNDNIEVITWERGVGKTLACGTGAAAAAILSIKLHGCSEKVNVHLLGGSVKIEQIDSDVYMTGPAQIICRGEYYWEA